MGCPSEIYLNEELTFSICTHDPDTGILTDADSLPTYRIYEGDSEEAIDFGELKKLDDPNTVGCYCKKIECSEANGFNYGKTYTIYIEATVDSDTGGIAFSFQIHNSPALPGSDGDTLKTLSDQIDAIGGGAGAISFSYYLNSSVDNSPIADADIWVTTDITGTNVIASGRTDQNGRVVFYLDAGTIYVWRQKSGWDFANPDIEVVS